MYPSLRMPGSAAFPPARVSDTSQIGGPLGSGMEETYQVTSALKHLPFGKYVSVLTDARFSGVSTGACIGHISDRGTVRLGYGGDVSGDLGVEASSIR